MPSAGKLLAWCEPVDPVLLVPDALAESGCISIGKAVLVENGRIRDVGHFAPSAASRAVRLPGTLLPGFVDLQVNGSGGRGCDEDDPAALDVVARAVQDGGAAAFLPTLITAPFEVLLARTRRVAAWIADHRGPGATPLGIHLEGPFLEASGVHDRTAFVDPTPERLAALLAAAAGTLKLVTLAPARAGAAQAVAWLRAHGVQVAVGHAESPEHFTACVDAGAGMATHLFNAMGALHHRKPGIAGLALDDGRVSPSLIVDGAHVHPAMVRNAFRCLGVDRTILVTDAVAAAGMPDGPYELSGLAVRAKDGVVTDAEGRLAGSALTMARAARNFLAFVPGCGAWTLSRVAASNPARAIAVASEWGEITIGKRARFALLGTDGQLRSYDPPD